MTDQQIGIIGAGVAGLTCADRLWKAGLSVTIFEKSRAIGGRMATRVISDDIQFDHGAQYVRGKSPAFAELVDELKLQHTVADWSPRSVNDDFSADGVVVGVPRMRDFVAPLAMDLDIHFSTEVQSAEFANDVWTLKTENDAFQFDLVISSIPAPQAERIFGLTDELADVQMAPCWALLLTYAAPLDLGFDVWRNVSDDLGWIARNTAKPGRGAGECWVVHASSAWSEENLEHNKEDVAPDLVKLFETAVGADLPKPVSAVAHRWRFAQTTEPLGKPFLSKPKLLVGGDWCLGARVDSAFQSGIAMADAAIAELTQ